MGIWSETASAVFDRRCQPSFGKRKRGSSAPERLKVPGPALEALAMATSEPACTVIGRSRHDRQRRGALAL